MNYLFDKFKEQYPEFDETLFFNNISNLINASFVNNILQNSNIKDLVIHKTYNKKIDEYRCIGGFALGIYNFFDKTLVFCIKFKSDLKTNKVDNNFIVLYCKVFENDQPIFYYRKIKFYLVPLDTEEIFLNNKILKSVFESWKNLKWYKQSVKQFNKLHKENNLYLDTYFNLLKESFNRSLIFVTNEEYDVFQEYLEKKEFQKILKNLY